MAITQALCTSFKVELLTATHDFTASTGDTFKIALFTNAADLGVGTTAYSTAGEVLGTGYTAGGEVLTVVTPTAQGTSAVIDFEKVIWSSATFTTRGALIYNSSKGDRAVAVVDFGENKSVTGGTFIVQFPSPITSAAIIRIT